MPSLTERLDADIRDAMRARDRQRVAALRLVRAALKQREVDTRQALSEADAIAVLDRLARQRRESIAQFSQAGREDLAARERYELELITGYLPQPLSEAEIEAAIDEALASTGARSRADMGAVMAALRPRLQGRADLGAVSALVRKRLS